jgi:hypothetical protein
MPHVLQMLLYETDGEHIRKLTVCTCETEYTIILLKVRRHYVCALHHIRLFQSRITHESITCYHAILYAFC